MLLGAGLGAAAGVAAHTLLPPGLVNILVDSIADPVGQVFLRLLFLLVLPLIFAALTLGVAGLQDLGQLGRMGLKTLAYTVVASLIAVTLGLLLANLLGPGRGISDELRARIVAHAQDPSGVIAAAKSAPTLKDFLIQIVPTNPLEAAAKGDYLGWMFFSLLFGVGLCLTRTEGARRFEAALQGLYDVCMRLIGVVISLAPIGVFALLFTLTARLGYEILEQLLRYVGVVLLALGIHQFVVYSLAVRLLGGMSPRAFFRGITEAMVTAFSTSSSNATLPTTLKVAEEKLKLPAEVSRFVLTIGATANQNGTALFAGVTVLFLAQFYGVELSLQQQVTIGAICVVSGIGTAGIPSGSLPVVAMLLGLVHVPVEGIGLVLGVDRFLDMCRTTLNVTGDLSAAVVVARGEKGLGRAGS
ncbi:MAG: dicarboxylate/amino acid:cation symporter [Planctomycetota bacterium]|nr:MAG: dicarboxylate/amino acid:cation symporter [Planctomycetota bacterium]